MTRTRRERKLHAELAALRRSWKAWKHGGAALYLEIGCHGGHPALYFCNHHAGIESGCEGCGAEQYRADQRTELEARAAQVLAVLAVLAGGR